MKQLFATTLIILLSIPVMLTAQENKEAIEPNLILEVDVNGKHWVINEKDTISIGDSLVTIKASNYKVFDFGKVSFHYPKHFLFTYEKAFTSKTWSVYGNNMAVVYAIRDYNVDFDYFVKLFIGKSKAKDYSIEDVETKLGKKAVQGKRIIYGRKYTAGIYDLYPVEVNDYSKHYLILKNYPTVDGSNSQEVPATIELLSNSFKIKGEEL
ncbi:MAG: hypothetical protein K9H64_08505 [Bacteroidales bacterium]|nr:hypothetical protein [Bacteroidales bacterium]MCF8455872.1 hypothetical protein [Bacteroidales bacterium]